MKGFIIESIGPIRATVIRNDVLHILIADGVNVHSDIISLLKILAAKQIVLARDA